MQGTEPHKRINHATHNESFRKKHTLKIESIFLIFWLVIGLPITIFAPCGTGYDEEEHIARAEQIAEGQFMPQEVDVGAIDGSILTIPEQYQNLDIYGGQTNSALYELLVLRIPSVHKTEIADMNFEVPYWNDERYSIEGSVGTGDGVTWAFPNTSVNSPLCYAPYSLGYAMAAMAATGPILCVILMRMFGVVAYGLIVRFAIKKVPICKRCLFLIAILPNSIAVATVVSADMMTNACSFLFLAYVLRFLIRYEEVRLSDYVGLGVSLSCLALLKMPYIAFGLLLILIFVANKMWRNKQATLKIAIAGTVALALFFWWSRCTNGIATYSVWTIDNADKDAQLAFIFQNPDVAFNAFFKQLCDSDLGLIEMTAYAVEPIPVWLTILACIVFVFADVQNCPLVHNRRLISICFVSLSFLIAILIIVALYLTFAPVGATSYDGVQSRYFVPVLFPIFSSIVMLLSGRKAEVAELGSQSTSALAFKKVDFDASFVAFISVYAFFALRAYSVWVW